MNVLKPCRAVALCSTLLGPAAAAQDFSKHWHDGRAELDGYRWEVTRYAQQRSELAKKIGLGTKRRKRRRK